MTEAAAGQRLHPASMIGTRLTSLPSAIAGMVGAFTVLSRQSMTLAVGAALLALVLTVGGAVLRWWRFRYTVAPGEIVIEQGVFGRQRRVIPFDRVRDVAIEQPLLARLLDTARGRIETGGGKADEGDLDMIGRADAERLREHIRASNRAAPAGAVREAEHAVAPDEPVIFTLSPGRLLLLGLFNFSLLFMAVLFAGLQYLRDFGLFDWEDWIGSDDARQRAGQLTLAAAVTLVGLLLLLGFVSGVVRTVLRDFNFRLSAGVGGLRRRRGLVTLSEVLIPARRTEAARIRTGLVSGLLGYHSLAFQTLGADQKEGGVQVAAPLATAAEIAAILGHAGFPVPPARLPIRPPRRALVRRCVPWLLLVPVVAVGAALIDVRFAWAALLPLLLAGGQALAWSRDRYRAGEDALFMARGVLGRTVWIIPYDKLQATVVTRGPVQRALGLVSVTPDTAGAPALDAPRVADLSQRDANALAALLIDRFQTARASRRAAAVRH